MYHFKSKEGKRGQTTVPIIVVIGAICAWCSGLSVAAFNFNGEISGLTSSVADIKENTTGLQQLKAEVDWLAKQKGYVEPLAVIASSTHP